MLIGGDGECAEVGRTENPSNSGDQLQPEASEMEYGCGSHCTEGEAAASVFSVGAKETHRLPMKRKSSDMSTPKADGSPAKQTKTATFEHKFEKALSLLVQGPGLEEMEEVQSVLRREATVAERDDSKNRESLLKLRISKSLPASQEQPTLLYDGKHAITSSSSQPQESDHKTGQELVSRLSEALQLVRSSTHLPKQPSKSQKHQNMELKSETGIVKQRDIPCVHQNALANEATGNSGSIATCSRTIVTLGDEGSSTSALMPTAPINPVPQGNKAELTSRTGRTPSQAPPTTQQSHRASTQSVSRACDSEGLLRNADVLKDDCKLVDPHQVPSQPPRPSCKELSPALSLLFSSESEEEEEEDGDKMLSTQMNKQIDRVQLFLKMDRLKRPRRTKPTGR